MLPGFRTNEAQVLDVSLQKNSVRDTVIGKRWICLDSESTLHRVLAIAEGECSGHGMWCGWFFMSWVTSYANEWEDHSNNWGTTP